MTSSSEKKRYARAKTICSMLAISPATLWRWVKFTPAFPTPLKPSRGVTLFDLDEIDAYLQAQCR